MSEKVELKAILKDWRLHVVVLGIVVLTELVGQISIPVGPGAILLLPMLWIHSLP